jgi:hypothetical protein
MKKYLLLCFVFFLGTSAISAQTIEKWFVSNMNNNPIGFFVDKNQTAANEITSATYMKLIFNRKGSKIEMLMQTEIKETLSGDLLTAKGNIKTTGQDIALEGVLKKDTMFITMSTGGKTYQNKLFIKEKLEGPNAVKNRSLTRLKQPGDSITYATFSPDLGIVVHVTRKYLDNQIILINGVSQTAIRIKESFKENPFSRELFVDPQYQLLKTIDPSPFGNIESIASTKDIAENAATLVTLPVESYEKTVIKSNVRFMDPRNLEQVTFKIRLTNPNIEMPDLTSTHQKVLEKGKDYAIVQYTRPNLPQKSVPVNTTALNDFLSPNSLINADDPEIIRIASELTRSKNDDFEKAVAIKNWVSANVKVDLGVALAPGSEVNKLRKGTCVAFSTYFGSLLRAAKIPARYMGGYVYMNGIWGGHAWIEIFYKGTWLPMDATINSSDIADAARLSFGDGWSLKNGIAEFAASKGGVLYGNADIKVISYTIYGKKIKVPEEEKTYRLETDRYINPGKKMTIQKTVNYEFKMLDELWPSKSFVTIEYKNGTIIKIMDGYWMTPRTKEEAIKVELEAISKSKIKGSQLFKGNTLYTMEDPTKAFFVKVRGKELLLWYAQGNHPIQGLMNILEQTKFD